MNSKALANLFNEKPNFKFGKVLRSSAEDANALTNLFACPSLELNQRDQFHNQNIKLVSDSEVLKWISIEQNGKVKEVMIEDIVEDNREERNNRKRLVLKEDYECDIRIDLIALLPPIINILHHFH